MAQSIKVLLSFIHGRLEKMRQIGREHGWRTSQGTLKNATIAMNIIEFILDLRYDPTYVQILDKEGGNLLNLIAKSLHQYAERHGYSRGKRN